MKTAVYSTQGKQVADFELPKEIFEVSPAPDLIHQTAQYYQNNQRIAIAHTKNRGEVSGGGKKPWRQKGTGRARHGSTRSPIWVGGGVTFGPTNKRNFTVGINKRMKRAALFAVLAEKARRNLLIIVDELAPENAKAKTMNDILTKLPSGTNSTLIALPGMEKNIIAAALNLDYVKTVQARELNAFDLLNFQYIVMPKAAVQVLMDTFVKNT